MMSPSGSPPFLLTATTATSKRVNYFNNYQYNNLNNFYESTDETTEDERDEEQSTNSSAQYYNQITPSNSYQNKKRTRRNRENQNNQPRLQSLTVGGYGPIPQEEEEIDEQKDHGKKLHSRLLTFCLSIGAHEHQTEHSHYIDTFNDQSWSCSYGTLEEHGIWMNTSDQAGIIMAFLVWLLLIYSNVFILHLCYDHTLPFSFGLVYTLFCHLSLSCHAKTMLTDPGSVPQSAVPLMQHVKQSHAMCSQCQTFKPRASHHCRICNRCIAGMDHHCPWMNNCVGTANLKHFILFLIYIWFTSFFAMFILMWSWFFCAEKCSKISIVLVITSFVISLGVFLFSSSMIMNVTYGIMTGIGTIDRLKKKATNTMMLSEEEPIRLRDIFGIAGYWSWWLPIDPLFEDYEKVMGYSTPQRLLREQMKDFGSVSDYKV